MKSTRYIGISFHKGHLQLAEVEHGKKPSVTALGERRTALDFYHNAAELSPDHPQLFTFVYELEELLKESRAQSKIISFALPTEPVFINIIPVDAQLQGGDLTSYLHWELEQYYSDVPIKDFIIGSQALPWGDKNVKQMFVVSIRRGIAGFLKKAAGELKLQLHIVDVDHFSTEKTLRASYPEYSSDNVALFGVQQGRVDASLMLQGAMCDYRAFVAESSADIKKGIISYLKYLKEKEGVEAPGHIILHGIDITPEMLSLLQRETGIETTALDAVRNLSPSKKLDKTFIQESSRFAAAVGLALRASA